MSDARKEILEDLGIVDEYFQRMFNTCYSGDEKMYLDLEEKISNAIEWIENLTPETL